MIASPYRPHHELRSSSEQAAKGWYTRVVKLKTNMLELWSRYEEPAKAYILSLRDVRSVGSLAFVVLVLLISWSGVKAIQTNYKLQQEVSRMKQENEVKKLQNTNQELQNSYYKTSQYLEVTSRQNFGLAAPGETVLIVPKDVALAHTVPMPSAEKATAPAKKQPFWQENFQAWMDFFFHRTQV
jgi:cell division protein FtsB